MNTSLYPIGNCPTYISSPLVSCGWSTTPDTHFEDSLSLEGSGDEGDDDDNIAYRKILVSSSSWSIGLDL